LGTCLEDAAVGALAVVAATAVVRGSTRTGLGRVVGEAEGSEPPLLL